MSSYAYVPRSQQAGGGVTGVWPQPPLSTDDEEARRPMLATSTTASRHSHLEKGDSGSNKQQQLQQQRGRFCAFGHLPLLLVSLLGASWIFFFLHCASPQQPRSLQPDSFINPTRILASITDSVDTAHASTNTMAGPYTPDPSPGSAAAAESVKPASWRAYPSEEDPSSNLESRVILHPWHMELLNACRCETYAHRYVFFNQLPESSVSVGPPSKLDTLVNSDYQRSHQHKGDYAWFKKEHFARYTAVFESKPNAKVLEQMKQAQELAQQQANAAGSAASPNDVPPFMPLYTPHNRTHFAYYSGTSYEMFMYEDNITHNGQTLSCDSIALANKEYRKEQGLEHYAHYITPQVGIDSPKHWGAHVAKVLLQLSASQQAVPPMDMQMWPPLPEGGVPSDYVIVGSGGSSSQDRQPCRCFERLIAPRGCGYQERFGPWPSNQDQTMHQLREGVLAKYGALSLRPRRPAKRVLLYDRMDAHRRRWLNAPELLQRLKLEHPQMDIELIQDFPRPFDQQVLLHNQVDILIEAHGAGFYNTFWMPDDCLVFELGWTEPWYKFSQAPFQPTNYHLVSEIDFVPYNASYDDNGDGLGMRSFALKPEGMALISEAVKKHLEKQQQLLQ